MLGRVMENYFSISYFHEEDGELLGKDVLCRDVILVVVPDELDPQVVGEEEVSEQEGNTPRLFAAAGPVVNEYYISLCICDLCICKGCINSAYPMQNESKSASKSSSWSLRIMVLTSSKGRKRERFVFFVTRCLISWSRRFVALFAAPEEDWMRLLRWKHMFLVLSSCRRRSSI